MYYCKKCKNKVFVSPKGEVIKTCNCNSPIIAEMKATVFNHSKIKA